MLRFILYVLPCWMMAESVVVFNECAGNCKWLGYQNHNLHYIVSETYLDKSCPELARKKTCYDPIAHCLKQKLPELLTFGLLDVLCSPEGRQVNSRLLQAGCLKDADVLTQVNERIFYACATSVCGDRYCTGCSANRKIKAAARGCYTRKAMELCGQDLVTLVENFIDVYEKMCSLLPRIRMGLLRNLP